MKYIKKFNENVENVNAEIIDYIKEIFIPITDDFFYCVVKPSYDYDTKKYGFSIKVGNKDMMISREYLTPYLEHLISYMSNIGYTEKVVDKPSIMKSFRFNFEFYPK